MTVYNGVTVSILMWFIFSFPSFHLEKLRVLLNILQNTNTSLGNEAVSKGRVFFPPSMPVNAGSD